MRYILPLLTAIIVSFPLSAASQQTEPWGHVLVRIVDEDGRPVNIGKRVQPPDADADNCHKFGKYLLEAVCIPFSTVSVNDRKVRPLLVEGVKITSFRLSVPAIPAGRVKLEFPAELRVGEGRYLVERPEQSFVMPKGGMMAVTLRLVRVRIAELLVSARLQLDALPGYFILKAKEDGSWVKVRIGKRELRTGTYRLEFRPSTDRKPCKMDFKPGTPVVETSLLCKDDKGNRMERCLCAFGESLSISHDRRSGYRFERKNPPKTLKTTDLGVVLMIDGREVGLGDLVQLKEDEPLRLSIKLAPGKVEIPREIIGGGGAIR